MNLNLGLLLPEWILCGALFLLALGELSSEKTHKPGASLAASAGIGLALLGLFPFVGKIATAFDGMYLLDPFAMFFKALFALACLVVIAMSRDYLKKTGTPSGEFYLILLSSLIGFFMLVSANDLLLLFIALEIITMSFYILTAFAKREMPSIESGIKYLIVGSLASAFLIFGISFIYVATGSTSFPVIRDLFTAGSSNPLFLIGLLFILTGLGFKIASVPFHLWVPDVYEGAPTPVVAFLSVASKSAGFAALLRILFMVFPAFDTERSLLFSILAAMTLLYGNLGALLQKNMKRLFGYSSIGHAGYLLIGVAVGGQTGVNAVLYYLLAYAVTTLSVFYVITWVGHSVGSDSLDAYRGLAKRSPFMAGVLFLALLSSAGVPPLAGFMGKFFVLLSAVQGNLAWLALLGALGVAVSLFYYLSIVRLMYFEDSVHEDSLPVPLATRWVLIVLSAGILIIGIWQEPFYRFTQTAARYLF